MDIVYITPVAITGAVLLISAGIGYGIRFWLRHK